MNSVIGSLLRDIESHYGERWYNLNISESRKEFVSESIRLIKTAASSVYICHTSNRQLDGDIIKAVEEKHSREDPGEGKRSRRGLRRGISAGAFQLPRAHGW